MIVVAGATGTLGPLLVPLLVARGEPVRVVTRDPERGRRFDGVEVVGADVCTPEGAREAVAGARVVISAITGFASPAGVRAVDERGNSLLASAAADAGVERFILVSVAQAAPDHPIELFRAKAAAEAAVRSSGDCLDDRSPDCLPGDLARHRWRADDRVWQGVDLWPRPQPDQLRIGSGRRTHDRARGGRSDRGSPDHRGARTPEPDVARSRRHRRGRDRTSGLQPTDPARDAPPVVGGATARQQDASPADRAQRW